MGAGTSYFALAIIRHFEKLGYFTLNSSESIDDAKDKLSTVQVLAANNIPIPKTMLAKFPLDLELVEKEFSFPVIMKAASGSMGKGVFLCEKKDQLEDMAEFMESHLNQNVNLILQEFVSGSKGKDIRVIVVGGRAIGAMLREAREGGFRSNYAKGGSVKPFPLNPDIEWIAVESAKALGLDVAGVDILFDGDSYKVCEVNSTPWFEGFEKATGIKVPEEIFHYIKVRLGE
jgi:RimK family alpha-L-glutamate ligase